MLRSCRGRRTARCAGRSAASATPRFAPPALILVAEAHIRRHYDPPWPEHDPDCDFYRDAAQQRAVTRSFRRPPDENKVALLANLKRDERPRPPQLTARSFSRSRGALATLLMNLVERAGLNQVASGGRVASLGDQYKAIRQAARGIAIDDDVSLAEFIPTYPPCPARFPAAGWLGFAIPLRRFGPPVRRADLGRGRRLARLAAG